ncbi:PBP1A family penicillin-binding protein [Thermoleptolyngbya sp. PKUAC-SCTB121]|uniref:PBP1A family penicillin-binding protein n=1 Tax=Thermoleptolyngbya sp. PKUAC-SCTB121 TaxID=2811482 RepID=UPI0019638203|nr:PBP1A family penicillin-binding protein [Thermoleptolyngbya sp. PKUAC-SCTB121]
MTQSPPPTPPKTLLTTITRAVQQARVNFSRLKLKPNARVPELWVQDPESGSPNPETYPLLGDRYLLGRSSRSCDIVVRNPVVSQMHLSLTRDSRRGKYAFVLKDENSTNGIYRGKRRLTKIPLRHGDVFTLGPPDLASAVRIQYVDPPPVYVKAARYGMYGFTGLTALTALWIGLEWQKFSVRPLPASVQGPVMVMARDGVTPLTPTRARAHTTGDRLSDFSRYLPDALIASEDSRYYWHLGIDPIGILRALVTNILGGGIREGGSTLTQQLARNIFRDYVGTSDSAGRKLREAVVALKLETFYSKDFLILEYLNRVYLGNGTYGFEDASQYYFGKPAKELTLSEAATLVGILPAPNSFNPVQDYETAVQLRDRVINRMAAQGKISLEEAERARRSRIEINPETLEELRSSIAPYFTSYVFSELEELLGSQLAQEGNFVVESSLDPGYQREAERLLRSTVESVGAGSGFSQGALVTLDSRTGEVLALVGGVDFQESQFNRATQALRQPGSTFKAFAYTAALEQGISPYTAFSCEPMTWQGQSFRGCERTSSGSADMYTGMALSENVIALRVGREAGLNNIVETARRMGITSPLNPVPGLVLGQSEVTLLELTGAYAVLANQGVRNRPHAVQRILDSSDCADPNDVQSCRVIYDASKTPQANTAVLPADIARTMTDLLQGVVSNGTGRAAYLGLGEAGKTGTNNDNRDLWFVGYVPSRQIATGIWFGNDDNSPTGGSSSQAAQLWGDYMGRIIR